MKSQLATEGDLLGGDGPLVSLARIQKYDMPKAKVTHTMVTSTGTVLPEVANPHTHNNSGYTIVHSAANPSTHNSH